MSAVLGNLLNAPVGFKLGDLAANLSSYGKTWGFDIAIMFGAILFVLGTIAIIKGVKSQQGAGGHYFKGAIACVFGAIFMFDPSGFEHLLGGSDLFSQLVKGNGGGFITYLLPFIPAKAWMFFL